MTKSYTSAILKAATESIPRGARKEYKPYWTEELQEVEDNLIKARKWVEGVPTTENNMLLKEAAAKYKLQSTKAYTLPPLPENLQVKGWADQP